MKKILVCIAACIACFNLYAQEEEHIETDRPSETETPHTVKLKYIQVETGIHIERTSEESHLFSHPTALIKYGLLRKLELRLRLNYSTLVERYIPDDKITSGLEPVTAGIKAGLWDEAGWIPRTALVIQTGIPKLASKGFREAYLSPEIRAAFKNTLSKGISISYNAGVKWEGGDKTSKFLYTVTPEFDLGKHLVVFVEAFGYINRNEGPEHSIDGGFEYLINNDLTLDLVAGKGLTTSAPGFYVNFGGSIRFR